MKSVPRICPAAKRPAYVVTVPNPDCYRGMYTDADAGERYAMHVNAAIDTLRERRYSAGGVHHRHDYFQRRSSQACAGLSCKNAPNSFERQVDLFIADEVQPGFGRTGDHFWGLRPMAWFPISSPWASLWATAIRSRRWWRVARWCDTFSRGDGYFNTFGGNPVSCAAALAVLDVIEDEGLQQNARTLGRSSRDRARGACPQA